MPFKSLRELDPSEGTVQLYTGMSFHERDINFITWSLIKKKIQGTSLRIIWRVMKLFSFHSLPQTLMIL